MLTCRGVSVGTASPLGSFSQCANDDHVHSKTGRAANPSPSFSVTSAPNRTKHRAVDMCPEAAASISGVVPVASCASTWAWPTAGPVNPSCLSLGPLFGCLDLYETSTLNTNLRKKPTTWWSPPEWKVEGKQPQLLTLMTPSSCRNTDPHNGLVGFCNNIPPGRAEQMADLPSSFFACGRFRDQIRLIR